MTNFYGPKNRFVGTVSEMCMLFGMIISAMPVTDTEPKVVFRIHEQLVMDLMADISPVISTIAGAA